MEGIEMKLKSIPRLLILPVLMLVLVGCGVDSQPPDIPTPLPLATYTPVMSAGTSTPVPTLTATTSPETRAGF